jgi:1,4-alpha-glucan branching enzyme
MVRSGYRIGVPAAGWYEEIFNSDSTYYAGSDVGNGPGVKTIAESTHGRKYTLEVTLPPLGVTIFKPSR